MSGLHHAEPYKGDRRESHPASSTWAVGASILTRRTATATAKPPTAAAAAPPRLETFRTFVRARVALPPDDRPAERRVFQGFTPDVAKQRHGPCLQGGRNSSPAPAFPTPLRPVQIARGVSRSPELAAALGHTRKGPDYGLVLARSRQLRAS